jgi:hypothetical protein
MTDTIIRIDTNQGIYGLGEVRDGASARYALVLKSRILGENHAISKDFPQDQTIRRRFPLKQVKLNTRIPLVSGEHDPASRAGTAWASARFHSERLHPRVFCESGSRPVLVRDSTIANRVSRKASSIWTTRRASESSSIARPPRSTERRFCRSAYSPGATGTLPSRFLNHLRLISGQNSFNTCESASVPICVNIRCMVGANPTESE